MTNNNQTSKYFRYEFWKKAKNALLNIVYGFVALVVIALPVAAIAYIIIAFSDTALILVIVVGVIFSCWIMGSRIRGEL